MRQRCGKYLLDANPYRGYAGSNYDIETDTKTLYLYLYRKFVAEGKEE